MERTFQESTGKTLQKLLINPSGELFIANGSFWSKKKLANCRQKSKAKKLQASTKYLQKKGKQGNLMIYSFNHTWNTIEKSTKKAAVFPFLRKLPRNHQEQLMYNYWSYNRWVLFCSDFKMYQAWNQAITQVLCFDILTQPEMPFEVMHRKEVTHSNGSYERKSCGRKLADEMGRGKKKSHYTLIDWLTGREWPLNCMTVISARWRSHRPF